MKQALIKLGFPVEDLAGYVDGAAVRAAPARADARGRAASPARLPARGGRYLPRRRRGQRRQRRDRAALRRGQDHGRHGRDGEGAEPDADPRRPTRRRAPVDARRSLDKTDARADDDVGEYTGDRKRSARSRSRPTRSLTYRKQHRQRATFPHFELFNARRLGPDHLRRGAPAAGAGLPRHGRDPGAAPAGPDRDAGARGRPRGGRLLA